MSEYDELGQWNYVIYPNKSSSYLVTAPKLLMNLNFYGINLSLLSQFMPIQYTKVREGGLENKPEALIKDRIRNTIDEYVFATNQQLL
ncbi:class II D-tagatose-bisphosphate aldolase, non-catalytic subunit [Erysipelotrichaceae bacterium RD49]|nr:class II D-tagatose-bisphosphate aldolase, non-catalytic subunit [Erysipelotrichaceae bacterium RD49]